MNLKDKVVVITGGTKGLGEALAFSFASKGAQVVISARKNDKDIQNNHITFISADVTKEQDVKELAGQTIAKFGHIDVWVNNAGVWLPHMSAEELDMKRVQDMFQINVFGTIYGSRVALSQMRKQGGGIIMNIISTTGLKAIPYSSAYAATKFAVSGFSRSLQLEESNTNIKVIAVYPGGMKTEIFNEGKPKEYEAFMEPSDVAEKIVSNVELENPEEELIIRRPTA